MEGNKTASIFSLSNMSLAIANVKAESIPPESPKRTLSKLLFVI